MSRNLWFAFLACASAQPRFGHQLLPLFALQPNYTNLNHGSYGSVPRSVTAAANNWTDYCEANPDLFYRFDGLWAPFEAVRARLAAYIGAEVNDTVVVENASNGVNAVLRSWARDAPKGKKFLYLS